MTFQNLLDKTQAIVQQAKGDIEVKTGHPVKGNADKIVGKIKEEVEDVKANLQKDQDKNKDSKNKKGDDEENMDTDGDGR